MARLLIIHHTPSPHMQAMFEAVVSGATDPEIEGVEVVRRAALAVTAPDVLAADGYLLGSPANLGYMSGGLKHGLDVIYHPALIRPGAAPFPTYFHGNEGTEGCREGRRLHPNRAGWMKPQSMWWSRVSHRRLTSTRAGNSARRSPRS
ncbi:flavodoxin [Nocardia sputorum]|uniref:flavodoxin family protein n=1 Tax=Nocardia sputorum TaxID=2984338 RepID=UPI0030910C6F|nr:flavodoxin [Nocardia sputorum]BDT96907.1 flavodoxin [Nocardia sputorum]